MPQFDLKNATVSLVDGTAGTPKSIAIKIGEGTLSYAEKKPRQYFRNRGLLDSVRNGDEEPIDVRLEATWEFLRADTGGTATIEDALKQRGVASTWVSSATDACAPYAVDIVIWYDVPCPTIKDETITLPDFRYEEINHDAKAGTLSLTGKCNATEAIIARVAQS